MPPLALSSSTASSAPCFMSPAMAANGPVSGSGNPMRTGSLLCARNTAGNAKVAAPAAVVVKNTRRFMGDSFVRASGADDRGGFGGCQTTRGAHSRRNVHAVLDDRLTGRVGIGEHRSIHVDYHLIPFAGGAG